MERCRQGLGFDPMKLPSHRFLDASQKLTPNLYPLSRLYAPVVRLIVVLFLQRGADGKFYIKRQEDYYEPQTWVTFPRFTIRRSSPCQKHSCEQNLSLLSPSLPGKLIPGGEIVVTTIKRVAAFNCMLLTLIFGLVLGFWRPLGHGATSPKN